MHNMHSGFLIAISWLVALNSNFVICRPSQPTVRIRQGKLMGVRKTSNDGSFTWYEYRGIPYSEPPIGVLRWQPPEPHRGWKGVLDATKRREICPQPAVDQFIPSYGNQTEDCLRLDIYVPKGSRYSGELPVMIYFHGGDFSSGGKNEYPGAGLSQNGVVVVVVNYRLGVLGFLSLGNEQVKGNYGLLDQHLAIKWTKKNIKTFGGDADKITVFGQSAGGVSAQLQMLSPYNIGFIKRAIAQSGSALYGCDLHGYVNRSSYEAVRLLKCMAPTTEEILCCLRALSVADIQMLDHSSSMVGPLSFIPVVDGDIIPDTPIKLCKVGHACHVEFITGFNQADALPFHNLISRFNANSPTNYLRLINPSVLDPVIKYVYADIFEAYEKDPTATETLMKANGFLTDTLFAAASNMDAREHSRACDPYNGKTFRYVFNYAPSFSVFLPNPPKWARGGHMDEMSLILRLPHLNDELADQYFGASFTSGGDREMSDQISRLWSNFAKTGDPNVGVPLPGYSWPPYTPAKPRVLEINETLRDSGVTNVITAEDAPAKLRPRNLEFWNVLIPKLQETICTVN